MILKNKRGNILHVISLFYRCCKGTTFISHIYSMEMLRNVKGGGALLILIILLLILKATIANNR